MSNSELPPLSPGAAELEAEVQRRVALAAQRAEEARQRAEAERLNVKPAPELVITRAPATCGKCGRGFSGATFAIGAIRITKPVCDECVAAHEAAATPQEPSLATSARWEDMCEPEYRLITEGGSTDMARLVAECPKLGEVTGWKFGPKGLLIRGGTGHCKTRAVWRLLNRLHHEGRSIAATSSGRFARDFADAAGNHRHSEWFDRLAKVDLWFLDDLGKKPWTANVWGEFFELVDERAKNHRPFILTTNETSATLFGPQKPGGPEPKCTDPVTREPLARRLRENCTAVVL